MPLALASVLAVQAQAGEPDVVRAVRGLTSLPRGEVIASVRSKAGREVIDTGSGVPRACDSSGCRLEHDAALWLKLVSLEPDGRRIRGEGLGRPRDKEGRWQLRDSGASHAVPVRLEGWRLDPGRQVHPGDRLTPSPCLSKGPDRRRTPAPETGRRDGPHGPLRDSPHLRPGGCPRSSPQGSGIPLSASRLSTALRKSLRPTAPRIARLSPMTKKGVLSIPDRMADS